MAYDSAWHRADNDGSPSACCVGLNGEMALYKTWANSGGVENIFVL